MKKNLLLTCFLTLMAVFGMAQTTQWPITLTKAEGLPGQKGPKNYTYSSPVYSVDEAITALRMTVVSTTRTDVIETGFDGMSSGWGTGFPFFTLGEIKVFDGKGELIEYVPTSNAASTWEGSYENLYDGNFATYFHTTWYKGACPQEYHYVELEFASPINVFQIEWNTINGNLNEPTYVGLTPGTEYLPYPEQNFSLGEKVETVDGLAEGGLFIIEGHAPEYFYGLGDDGTDNYDRGEPNPGGGFYHSPAGAHVKPNAASVVYLIPTSEENTYKVGWLNNDHFIAKQSTSAWLGWTKVETDAAFVHFVPSTETEGDFELKVNDDTFIIIADALGKMSCTNDVDTVLAKRSRPYARNFTIHKVNMDVAKVKTLLEDVVEDAEARVALYGFNEVEDRGEYKALTEAIAEAKTLLADANASPADVIASRNNINELLPPYVALGIYFYTDSIGKIIEAIDNEEILVSGAPNWVNGSYPEGSDIALKNAADIASVAVDTYTGVGDIDKAIADVIAAIDAFWASKISGVKSLPFRVGSAEDGLPGAYESATGYIWKSPTYLLTEEVSALRFTVFNTNTGDKYGDYVFPTISEFQLYDIEGNKIELTEENFKTNSVNPNDGQGLAGLCDGNPDTYYHGAYGNEQDPNGFDGKSEYVYIEVTLPEPISAFRYVQYGRVYSGSTRKNTPVDFVFGYPGTSVVPDDVPFADPYNAVLGEKITDVSQITDDGIYAIMGLLNCDPVNGTGEEGSFYSGSKRYGIVAQSPCAFAITSTGEEGTYYIQSLADGKYWPKIQNEDGWGNITELTTYYKENAAKVNIVPNNNAGLPNSFVLYQYDETIMRDGEPHPYVVFEDWGGNNLGEFSITGLDANDLDGEGEWYIYRLSMDNAYVYWLTNLVAAAEALGLEKRDDPGYYKDLGSFPEALAAAKDAVAAEDNVKCKELISSLTAAIAEVQNVTPNPVVEGTYIFESGYAEYFKQQGVNKALYVYDNDLLDNYVESDYKLYWGDAPEDYNNAAELYKFQLVSAKNSEQVAVLLEDSLITEEQAATAYFIKSVKYNCYIGEAEAVSKAIGMTEEPEVVYVVRQQVPTIYDIWNPKDANFSLHCEWNSAGAGEGDDVVYWSGSSEPSYWRLRVVDDGTSISDIVVDGEGDEIVSVTYYTTAGTASNAPVKGVNIVKTVYANGVIETKKILVK